MNILYIDPTQGTGGATKSLLDTLKYLDKSKFTPILLSHREGTFTQSFIDEDAAILDQKIRLTQAIMFDPFLGLGTKKILLRKFIKLFGMALKLCFFYITHLFD